MPGLTNSKNTGEDWKARLRDLLHECAASAPVEQADRIRETQSLLSQGTALMGESACVLPDMAAIECMLSQGAYESAVLALMGGDSAFMLSRGASGNCLATVVLPDGSEEMVAEGSTLALALLAAYLSSIIADGEQVLAEADFMPATGGARLH